MSSENESLKVARTAKKSVYKGLRVILATCRKYGRTFSSLSYDLFKGTENEVEVEAFILFTFGVHLSYNFVFEDVDFSEMMKDFTNKFNDELSSILYCINYLESDRIITLAYQDNLVCSGSRMDSFVINTNGERR